MLQELIAAALTFTLLTTASALAQPCGSEAVQSASGEPTQLALLVGVGDYPTNPGGISVSKLLGPRNDVEVMRSLLIRKGFSPENIKVLVDSEATREAILSAFCSHLVRRARSSDAVVFYFSGHGGQMGDQEPIDEPDGYDETIVPFDYGQPRIFGIRDDEIRALVRQFTTPNVTLILDSCNSGTAARAAFGTARRIEPDPRMPRRPLEDGSRAISSSNNGFLPANERYVLIAGARADRLSYETAFSKGEQPVTHGALTYYLSRELETATDATYREVFDRIAPQVTALFRAQEPQLEGSNQDNLLFKNINVLASPYVEISQGAAGLTLNAGAVHGVTKGSVYDVFPSGTREFSPEKKIGEVEVLQVNALDAAALIRNGQVDQLTSRAVEAAHNFSASPLRVYSDVNADLVSAVKAALGPNSSKIAFIGAEPGGSLGLRVVPPEDTTPPPRPEQIALFFPDGTQASPGVARTSSDVAMRLADQLQKWAKWFAVQGLTNPLSNLKASFATQKVGDPNPATGELVLREGEQFTMIVKNQSAKDLFVHIIDLASDGSITPVFPDIGAEEKIASGGTWTSDPYIAELRGDAKRVEDTARVILATAPIQISTILQPGIRSIGELKSKGELRGTNPLEELFANAGIEARQFGQAKVNDWLVLDQKLRIEKR